ncbi:MarR family winged helix-turn-helix transcriptional regulator [Streptosporangium sp. G11]|uniref:MarR family winged helix-turn-helix transcriptional regulator n=1 Tax=Streptosporangium sp. G11 TaxID=3436926 RepID=UPI003EB96534
MPLDPHDLDLTMLASLIGTALDERTLAALRDAGHPHLRRAHGFVFQHLIERQPTVGQLAESLGVTPQAASKYVVDLESLGYVLRETDPLDSRVRRIVMTPHGHHAVSIARELRTDLERELAQDLGDSAVADSRRVLVALLDRLAATEAITHRRIPLPRE